MARPMRGPWASGSWTGQLSWISSTSCGCPAGDACRRRKQRTIEIKRFGHIPAPGYKVIRATLPGVGLLVVTRPTLVRLLLLGGSGKGISSYQTIGSGLPLQGAEGRTWVTIRGVVEHPPPPRRSQPAARRPRWPQPANAEHHAALERDGFVTGTGFPPRGAGADRMGGGPPRRHPLLPRGLDARAGSRLMRAGRSSNASTGSQPAVTGSSTALTTRTRDRLRTPDTAPAALRGSTSPPPSPRARSCAGHCAISHRASDRARGRSKIASPLVKHRGRGNRSCPCRAFNAPGKNADTRTDCRGWVGGG